MINKQQLIKVLEEGLKVEESVIPLYSKHISNALFLSGLEKEKEAGIREILNKLRSDSLRHKGLFEDLLNKVRESNKDVY